MELIKGNRYIGTVAGIVNGLVVYSDVSFTASRNGEPDVAMIDGPNTCRVYAVKHPRHPESESMRVYIAGSIRNA